LGTYPDHNSPRRYALVLALNRSELLAAVSTAPRRSSRFSHKPSSYRSGDRCRDKFLITGPSGLVLVCGILKSMSDMMRIKKLFQANWHGARFRFVLVIILTVIGSILVVVDPILYGMMVDVIVNALTAGQPEFIMKDIGVLLGFWIALFITNTILSIGGKHLFWTANNIVGLNFARSMVEDMLRWSRQRFSRLSSGRAIKIIDQAWNATFWVPGEIIEGLLPTILSFVAVVVAGAFLDWRLTLVSMVMLPISVYLGVYGWKRARPKQAAIDENWSNLSKHIGESIGNISVVQNFAQENNRSRSFTSLMKRAIKKQLQMNLFWAVFHGTGSTLTLIGRAVVFVFGVWLVANDMTTLGTLITFLGMLNFLLSPIQYAIANTLPRMSRGASHMRLYMDMADEVNDVQESQDARNLTKLIGTVELRGVKFMYKDQSRMILKEIDLLVPAGKSCALVGPSGGGKSTMTKLINRTIDPSSGSVFIDGKDVSQFTLKSLRRKIGVVTQETYLFHDTILNNVKFVRPSAKEKDVIRACKMAEAHEFIQRLPNRYKSMVGERGVKLSGGERQRIALARIFLADPPILILDESTSALDSDTEHRIQKTLGVVMKGRTTILIAHRLSTVYLADQIAVVKSGRIIDRGSHSELLKKKGLYNRLWSLQSDGYFG
jgi:ABC-type multidrug transport system fused ATPase/permease subunit